MGITICEVISRKDRIYFLNLPYILHRNHELWVPPLKIFEKSYINPKKNHHLKYSKITCFLAYQDGKPVGRIMGIINKKVNEKWNIQQARFCSFESINDQMVAHGLLKAVEEWGLGNRMDHIIGPFGFSNQDPQGFLIEGFEERSSIYTTYNFDYIPQLIENEGYTKEVDYVTYKIPVPEKIPEVYEKVSIRVLKRATVKLLEFTNKKRARSYLPMVLRFMNETYTEIFGFIPLTEEIIQKTSRTYSEIIDPNFIKILFNDKDEIVGFILGIKDITEGFIKANGKLLPIGYFQIKSIQKKSKRLDLLLGSIMKEYRGKGLDTLLGIAIIKSAHKVGMESMDSHHILESNKNMRAEYERAGGHVYKRHRVYRKEL